MIQTLFIVKVPRLRDFVFLAITAIAAFFVISHFAPDRMSFYLPAALAGASLRFLGIPTISWTCLTLFPVFVVGWTAAFHFFVEFYHFSMGYLS